MDKLQHIVSVVAPIGWFITAAWHWFRNRKRMSLQQFAVQLAHEVANLARALGLSNDKARAKVAQLAYDAADKFKIDHDQADELIELAERELAHLLQFPNPKKPTPPPVPIR